MPKFAQGRYTLKNPTKYLGNKTPLYRSSWEFAFMKFCDESPSVMRCQRRRKDTLQKSFDRQDDNLCSRLFNTIY